MVKRLLTACSLLLFILPAIVSCSVADVSAVTLVPSSANTVVQIQVSQILSNPALKLAYDELAKTKPSWPQTTDDVLNQFLQKTSLDPYAISTVVLFANIESTDETLNTYSGLIASGSFTESTVIAKIGQQTQQELTSTDYKGFKVYSDVQNKFEIVFIDQNRIVLGTPKAVRDTIDVTQGDHQSLSGIIKTALNRVGNAQVTGAFIPPEGLLNQVGESVQQQSQFSLKAFQDIDVIAFAFDLQIISLSSRIDAHFSNATLAQNTMDAITGLISDAKVTTQDENVRAALSNVRVSNSDSWLSIRGLNSLNDIMILIDSMPAPK